MTTYTAFFRTAAEYATHDFEAASPAQALRMARTFFAAHDEDLMFMAYDGGMPLDEIEIAGPERHALTVWRSDDMRLRLAAQEVLEALKDMLGDLPEVQKGICVHCGRNYAPDYLEGDCLSDDCPAYNARAAIAKACGDSPAEPKRDEGNMNTKRASWASAALAAFCAMTGQHSEEEVHEADIEQP